MPKNEWQNRVERARHLAREHPPAAGILNFYAAIAEFQRQLSSKLGAGTPTFTGPLPESLFAEFPSFLVLAAEQGPPPLAEAAAELNQADSATRAEFLTAFWYGGDGTFSPGAADFLARAFLQPCAVIARGRRGAPHRGPTPCLCPDCGRKPGSGVLRQQGDGGLRSLICSFCLGEWEFRRILCPACGQEDHAKLPIYTAEEFPHVRVECCDACRCYLKTVDLTKSGLADPVVDELAAIPLDLWARQKGYAKLQGNLLQM